MLACRRPDSECFGDKSSNFAVNLILRTRTNMPIDDQLDVFLGDVAGHCAENGIQDDCEVYNVAHDAADIFLTDRCEISIDQAMMDL